VKISVSRWSRLQVRVANTSAVYLFGLWLVLYLVLVLLFAELYRVPSCAVTNQGGMCENEFLHLVYFSFTTQCTLGGDFVPKGVGKWFSAAQVCGGLALNAVLLGVTVFKLLKHPNPLIFSRYLVYEPVKHKFWFRFVNCDADRLRDVEVKVQLASPGSSQSDYDTQANDVPIKPNSFVMPKLQLFAFRTQSNEGKGVDIPADQVPVTLAPGHLSGGKKKRLEITAKGYFESTGDVFYCSKQYRLEDMRCGAFDDLDNNALEGKSDSDKAAAISERFERVISTSLDKCVVCPHHKGCELDIAAKTRGLI
jgi:hypothetical protein